MSVFIHTEMSAEDELKNPKPFACLVKYVGDYVMQHCETTYLDCAVTSRKIEFSFSSISPELRINIISSRRA
jgi:hypothetical protein